MSVTLFKRFNYLQIYNEKISSLRGRRSKGKGKGIWISFFNISRTLPLGHLQNFRVLLGDSAFGSAKSQETPYFEV